MLIRKSVLECVASIFIKFKCHAFFVWWRLHFLENMLSSEHAMLFTLRYHESRHIMSDMSFVLMSFYLTVMVIVTCIHNVLLRKLNFFFLLYYKLSILIHMFTICDINFSIFPPLSSCNSVFLSVSGGNIMLWWNVTRVPPQIVFTKNEMVLTFGGMLCSFVGFFGGIGSLDMRSSKVACLSKNSKSHCSASPIL